MRVLLVKMSSLGDVVHTLPAISDAARHGIRFDWVVEEAFAAVPRRHPAVDMVLPIGWRRWRRDLPHYRRDLQGFLTKLRQRRYDLILDAQGLIKSAAVTVLARGALRAGFSRASAREGAAALAYGRRIAVPTGQHAITRLRQLFATALGYPVPPADAAVDYGITAGSANGGPCVLLHGTTWESKHWPLAFWKALADRARGEGFPLALASGSELELRRSQDIAGHGNAQLWDRLPLDTLIPALGSARLAIGVDSGLSHLAAALQIPTVVLYGSTSNTLTGCRGRSVTNLQVAFPCAPCLRRSCEYQGEPARWRGEAIAPACYATLPPDRVWREAGDLLSADRILHL